MNRPSMAEGVFYLVVAKKGHDYNPHLTTPKITKNQPTVPRGHIAIKLDLRVPVTLFETFIPEGTIVLPEDASVGRPALEVRVPQDLAAEPNVELTVVPFVTDLPRECECGGTLTHIRQHGRVFTSCDSCMIDPTTDEED